jgi:hypothetical protein
MITAPAIASKAPKTFSPGAMITGSLPLRGGALSAKTAKIEGRKSVAESRPRRQIPKWHRGYQNVGSPRRLIDPITQSPA